MGGMFKSVDYDVKDVPHQVKPEDLINLYNFFDMISLDRFKKYFSSMPA